MRVHTVVISAQHAQFDGDLDVVRADLKEKVIKEVIPAQLLDERTIYYLNPCGQQICFTKYKHFQLISTQFSQALSMLAVRRVTRG